MACKRTKLRKRVPCFAGKPPAALAITEPSHRVEEGVVIGADREAVKFKVVSGVCDHRKVTGGKGSAQSIGELRATDAAGEQYDA